MSRFGLPLAGLALALGLAAAPLAAQQASTTAGTLGVSETTDQTQGIAPSTASQDATAATAATDTAPADTAPAPPPAAASAAEIDYAAWNRVAQRAERAIQADRASDQALAALRSELAGWREQFAKARADNQVRINTLKTQIATLGPPPAEGGSEPAILTEKRTELTADLDALEAPVKNAQVAWARANALIGELDDAMRTRQTDALFSLGPTPVNPANWPKALSDVAQSFRLAWSGITSSWGTDAQRAELRANLPLTLVLSVIALALILRGRAWVMRAGARVQTAARGHASGVWSFLISLGQVILPYIGVLALTEALHTAGVLGLRAQVIVDTLPWIGLTWFTARWLGGRVFGPIGQPGAIGFLPPVARAEGRFYTGTLGLLLGLLALVLRLADYETWSDATRAVLTFPIIAFSGFLLFRLGQILRRFARESTADLDDGAGFRQRTARLGGGALLAVGLLGPAAAAVGYASLGNGVVFPTIYSLAIVASVLLLHQFFVDLYAMVMRLDDEAANNALVPIIASSLVGLAVLPLLALTWGARTTDLTEAWTRLTEGVTIGSTVITPANIITFAIVFGIGYALTRLVQGMLKATILPKTKMDVGGQNAITSGLGYVGLFLAALAAITAAGIDLSSLAIVAGALSVGIGFGLQNIVSNFVSGIILLIERPISQGDWIEVGGNMGIVKDISVRSTRIETFDRTDVILPNSDLISGTVTNYTRGNLTGRVLVQVGVAYGSDTRRIEEILREIAQAHPLVTVNPPPTVTFAGFGADSLDFEIRAILKDVNFKLVVHSELNHEIARRFVEEGIEIPFAQRDIWLRNPEALAKAAPQAPAPKPKSKSKRKAKPAPEAEEARSGLDVDDMQDSAADDE